MDDKQLINIFNRAEKTLINKGVLSEKSRDASHQHYQELTNYFFTATDNDFFFKMVMVVFFSGFKATTVANRKNHIEKYFSDYKSVAKYTEAEINTILKDKNMIRNNSKINALVYNAKKFNEIINKYDSFKNFILSFNKEFPYSYGNLDKLREALKSSFMYLGPATVNHFLTDYGFPVLKPDRMVMRVLNRAHVVDNESMTEYDKAIEIGVRISKLLNIPIRYVDGVFVALGMTGEANLCRKEHPRCNECLLEKICMYNESP